MTLLFPCLVLSQSRNPAGDRLASSEVQEVVVILVCEEKYERMRKECAQKDAIGIPKSVRELYEQELFELQGKLRELRQGCVFGEEASMDGRKTDH